MEDLKLEDDDNIPAVSGGEALFAMLRSRELGTLGRWPPREKRKKKPNLPSSNNQSEAPTSNSVEVSAEVAEERLIYREKMEVLPCKLNGLHTRSTFLMVFSPDKELMASTHGDHNIYISEVKTGDCVQTLKGHPRTPWCIAFHPAHNGLLASGCLGGHVKVRTAKSARKLRSILRNVSGLGFEWRLGELANRGSRGFVSVSPSGTYARDRHVQ